MAREHAHTAGGHDHSHGHDHAHAHGHAHDHHHGGDEKNENRIAIAALLTGGFMGVELAGGILAGSLALMADAGHMLSDFGSLALAWIGFRMARRPADARRTFGFRRFPVLAAFVNGLAIFAIAVWIVVEAIQRLRAPQDVDPTIMLWVAVGGLAMNIVSFLVLHGADRDNLNVRGALVHVVGDLLGSVAAIVGAIIIMTTGWVQADPLLSILVALIILRAAWSITRESAHILLEGAPQHVDLDAVTLDLKDHVEGVEDIHHAHLWSLDGRRSMMTLHAKVANEMAGPGVVTRIKTRLRETHGIGHATVEIEVSDCAEGDCG
ncbi:MAG TPA: cation diffusion facilitator family transporter [Hyphomonadaceae bacterium]|jgi:cobalt-zinc-cadmium efflux system protein|nr:cation diffusion facilitator family transporter [Hyphomonadaceae bacterium]